MGIKQELRHLVDGIKEAADYTATTGMFALGISGGLYAIPSWVSFFRSERYYEEPPLVPKNHIQGQGYKGLSIMALGLVGGLAGIVAQAPAYIERPSLVAVPVATNLVSLVYEAGKMSRRSW